MDVVLVFWRFVHADDGDPAVGIFQHFDRNAVEVGERFRREDFRWLAGGDAAVRDINDAVQERQKRIYVVGNEEAP